MKSCAFFGHRKYNYAMYAQKIEEKVKVLIVDCGVQQFYSGGRGKFDLMCAKIVKKLQSQYSNIKITQVLSYIPQEGMDLLDCFDDSLYLLERNVPKRFAIIETNKLLVNNVDFIISGVEYSFGGAAQVVEYAQRKHKKVISIFE